MRNLTVRFTSEPSGSASPRLVLLFDPPEGIDPKRVCAASSLPASIVVCALAIALVRIHEYPAVRVFLAIAVLVAALLVLSSAIALLRPYVRRPALVRAAIVAAVAGVMILAGVTPVRILLLSAILGAVIGGSTPPAGAAE